LDKKNKIVQLANAHSNFDNRIFNKISKSLASHGYDVDLIVQHDKDETVDGVHIKALPIAENKMDRFVKIMPRLFYKSIQYPPKTVFHFHEPELLPVGFMLKLFGYTVIYDIHEDNATGILQKEYLPEFFKRVFFRLIVFLEKVAHDQLHTIIAEEYYEERFPKALKVLNYPKLDWAKDLDIERGNPTSILYTGSITIDRGAVNHIELLKYLDDSVKLKMIGVCAFSVHEDLKRKAEDYSGRLEIIGASGHVPFKKIIEQYRRKEWIVGLAVFPETPHYKRKYLTKFFEYMAAGLPIIYSDFPSWRKLLEPLNVGIPVDPENTKEVVKAIQKVKDSDALRNSMAKNGRKAVLERYNWDEEERKLLDFFKKIT